MSEVHVTLNGQSVTLGHVTKDSLLTRWSCQCGLCMVPVPWLSERNYRDFAFTFCVSVLRVCSVSLWSVCMCAFVCLCTHVHVCVPREEPNTGRPMLYTCTHILYIWCTNLKTDIKRCVTCHSFCVIIEWLCWS